MLITYKPEAWYDHAMYVLTYERIAVNKYGMMWLQQN
jgi:hypothetical protein